MVFFGVILVLAGFQKCLKLEGLVGFIMMKRPVFQAGDAEKEGQ